MSTYRTALTMRFSALSAVRRAGVVSSRSFQSCRILAAGKESKEGMFASAVIEEERLG